MANYLYNGVKLPELPELSGSFLNAIITRSNEGEYTLFVINKKPWYTDKTSRPPKVYYECVQIALNTTCTYKRYKVSDGVWVKQDEPTVAPGAVFAYKSVSDSDKVVELIWSNWDILDSEEVLYFAASEPVPVLSIDHTAMVQGWIVGKRLAAMRSKKLPTDITDATFENGVLYIKNASAVLNGSVLEVK